MLDGPVDSKFVSDVFKFLSDSLLSFPGWQLYSIFHVFLEPDVEYSYDSSRVDSQSSQKSCYAMALIAAVGKGGGNCSFTMNLDYILLLFCCM